MAKKIIGLIEPIKIVGKNVVGTTALFDTGAKLTSIDNKIAAEAQVGPVLRTQKVKAPITKEAEQRPVVKVRIEINGREYEAEANLNDRSHMKYPVIIGRNIIHENFIIDVSKHPQNGKRVKESKGQ
ncbi:MAG: hypothetical protein GTN38_03855 [Candidatus Aenigmarchaeota archaeon]|nr:hypothetical protein [Candidatus Aenigmarchaeota archaeon]NIP40797.1 hypothetical protein [Candidatus Aenigmarchaeota archaeon]NIQ17911.1 hypothetical protein [Candidatus Aenigmarchaeota archaeon]NIS73500.1 hypothetical protein [Candidatus Aenigmarchaeota archaeon]